MVVIHTYMHTYTHTYMHTYMQIHTYVHTYIQEMDILPVVSTVRCLVRNNP